MIKNRKLNRLTGFDYSRPGSYFVTVCVTNRKKWLGEIKDGSMVLNECGKIIHGHWSEIPYYYPNVLLDQFIVMPNHVHGIINIVGTNNVGTGYVGTAHCAVPTYCSVSLSQIIKSFKDITTKRIREKCGFHFAWQRSFHDHIIRNDLDLFRTRDYIKHNALKYNSNPK